MATSDNEVSMMMSVYPGAMTGFAALQSGLVSINNIFMQTMARIDDNFGVINASIIATGAVVGQFAADCVTAFGEFEQGMKIVQMVSGQTAQDIEYLSQKANEFSVSYRMDIDQITEGLQTLGRAGLNTASEQTEVLQNGLNTAKLEGRDLNGVLEELIQNTALLGGNLKSSEFGEDSGYINDLLVATSMTAPITTHDISETLKYSGGIAAAAGAKIRDDSGNVNEQGKAILEDYMGTIAAFAQKGVTGSIAGTALRAFLNKPATQDSSVTEALASIKLKPEYLWEEDEEVMKPISQQISIIQGQMDKLGVSTMDRLQIWSKIVGGKMGQQMMKLDSESIKDITKDIQSADDATSLAEGSMQTLHANIKEISEAGERFKRSIGGDIAYFANPYLELIAKIVEFGQNDFMSWPISITIIGFLGLVATKIRAVFAQLKSEISTIMTALKNGAGMVTARQLKGDRGTRSPLPGEKYTEADFKKDVSPAQLLKGFRQQFQSEAAKSLVGLTKENAAIVEASKGWSAKSDYLSDKGLKYVSDDGKSFIQSRDNAVIAQLARHDLLSKEVQKAFFTGTKKEEIMSTPLSNGLTVREEIEKTFLKLQGELRKTAAVLNEASTAAENAATAEQQETVVKQEESVKTSETIKSGAEKNVLTTAEMAAQMERELLDMAAAVTASTAEMSAQVKRNVATMFPNRMTMINPNNISSPGGFNIPNIPILASGAFWDPDLVRKASDTGQTHSGALWNPVLFQRGMAYQDWADQEKERFRQIFGIPKNVPTNPFSKDGMFYDPTTGKYVPNLENLMKDISKGSGKGGSGLPPNFITGHFYEFDEKTGRINTNVPHYAPGTIGPHLGNNITPVFPGTIPFGMNLDKMLTQYKEDYIRTRIQTGKGVSASNYGALLRTTGIDYEALDKEAVARKNAALEQSNIIAEEIKQELLTIANELTQQEAALARQNANAVQNQKDMNGLAKAAGINAAKQAAEGGTNRERKAAKADAQRQKEALDKAGTGYPTRMSTSTPDQVHGESKTSHVEGPVTYPKGFYDTNKAGSIPGYVNPSKIQDAVNSMKSQYTQSGPGISAMARLNSQQINQTNELIHSERTLSERIKSLTYKLTGAGSRLKTSNKDSGMWASFKGTLKDRWNADRSGRFLNFGTGRIGGKVNGALNMLDAVGGPFMVAMMAIPAILNYVQGIYEDYAQELKDIKETVKSAYSDRKQTEDSLKQLYRENNKGATNEDAEDFVLEQYGEMYDSLRTNNNNFSKWIEMTSQSTNLAKQYEMNTEKDDGSMKEVEEEEKTEEQQLTEAIKQNNAALYEATAQLQLATNKLTTKMQDGMWGIDGLSSKFSDSLGEAQDTWFGFTEGSGSIESGFLKTASQKDDNYAGDTELTGLLLEDFKDANGDWREGLKTIFGKDYQAITSTMSPKAKSAMNSMATFSNSLGAAKNARLQSSMMNDRKSWQMLAKEMAKYEKKTGKHAMTQETTNKRMENLIKKLQIDTHLSRAQVIAAAQLQQLQDMYQVAEQTFVPLMADQAATAARLYDTTSGSVDPNTGQAAGGAVSTAANAAQIAAYLSVMAENAAIEASYNEDLLAGRTTAKSKEEYLQEAAGTKIQIGTTFHKPAGMSDENWSWSQLGISDGQFVGFSTTYGGDIEKQKRIAHALEYQGDRLRNPNWTDKQVSDYSKRIDEYLDKGVNFDVVMKMARENYAGASQGLIEAAYLSSGVGEEDGDSGSGSGSGSGSDSDNNDKGTRKERVDLVLCNKKEIPKLNVNLFKKPPTFTVLNKNFKVRDVKINTEDTPKAIMASIKNAFIDVQKRSDPKIIQDEEAEYDPVAATDGNAVPSGSSKTGTS